MLLLPFCTWTVIRLQKYLFIRRSCLRLYRAHHMLLQFCRRAQPIAVAEASTYYVLTRGASPDWAAQTVTKKFGKYHKTIYCCIWKRPSPYGSSSYFYLREEDLNTIYYHANCILLLFRAKKPFQSSCYTLTISTSSSYFTVRILAVWHLLGARSDLLSLNQVQWKKLVMYVLFK